MTTMSSQSEFKGIRMSWTSGFSGLPNMVGLDSHPTKLGLEIRQQHEERKYYPTC